MRHLARVTAGHRVPSKLRAGVFRYRQAAASVQGRAPRATYHTRSLDELLQGNKEWATKARAEPYFESLDEGQNPRILWIGCADSRAPPAVTLTARPGELFVHRNVANLVVATDSNFMSVLQYAVDVLKVEEIVVCGHYGCGGVAHALSRKQVGVTDEWVRQVKETAVAYNEDLLSRTAGTERVNRLVELNVIQGLHNVAKTAIVQGAWRRTSPGKSDLELWQTWTTNWPRLRPLVYDLKTGLMNELDPGPAPPQLFSYEHVQE